MSFTDCKSQTLKAFSKHRLEGYKDPRSKEYLLPWLSEVGLGGLSLSLGPPTNPIVKQTMSYPPLSVPGIKARNIFLHTWNLKSSEMTGNWISSLAGGGDSDRTCCSLGVER